MVALNFQPQFSDDVEYGHKCQTIRRTARCKPGDTLQFFAGQRTTSCRKLGQGVCTRVTPVRLCDTEMFLDGKRVLSGDARRADFEDFDNDFARRDGFQGYMEMADWFRDRYGVLPFEGYVIQWTPR